MDSNKIKICEVCSADDHCDQDCPYNQSDDEQLYDMVGGRASWDDDYFSPSGAGRENWKEVLKKIWKPILGKKSVYNARSGDKATDMVLFITKLLIIKDEQYNGLRKDILEPIKTYLVKSVSEGLKEDVKRLWPILLKNIS